MSYDDKKNENSTANPAVGTWAEETEEEITMNPEKESGEQDNCSTRKKSPKRAWKTTSSSNSTDVPMISPQKHATDQHDLRNRLRRSRDAGSGNENQTSPSRNSRHSNSGSSHPNHRNSGNQRDTRELQGANYKQGKDGLGPLRSPLNSDQRASRRNNNSRRRSMKGDHNEDNASRNSPSKRNRSGADGNSSAQSDRLNGTEEHRFRRRLDLRLSGDDENKSRSVEEDKATLARREKQIQYGKATYSYKMYSENVTKNERLPDRKVHPRTPNKTQKCSRRNWDAQIKAWKKYVHLWANSKGFQPPAGESDSASSQLTDKGSSLASDEENGESLECDNEDVDVLDLEADDDYSFLEGFDLEENLKSVN